jgi:hypothetical protein
LDKKIQGLDDAKLRVFERDSDTELNATKRESIECKFSFLLVINLWRVIWEGIIDLGLILV